MTKQTPIGNRKVETPTEQSFAQNMFEITKIIGPKPDYNLLTKPVAGKRAFKDEKGVFYEMHDDKKGKKTVAE